MKRNILTLLVFFCVVMSKAQDADTTVVESETYQEYEEGDTAEEEDRTHDLVEPKHLQGTRNYQSEKLEVRKFDEAEWKKVVGDRNYNEKPRKMPEDKSSGEGTGRGPITIAPWAGSLLQVVVYTLIVGVVILLLYLVFRNMSFDVKLKRSNAVTEDFSAPVENIEVIDVDAMLERAKIEGNFRLAVRLYYLKLLKQLNQTGMISWKKDKTNRDYLSELFSKDYYFDEVKRLTLSYEQVWYGERSLTRDSFQLITEGFEAIYQKITVPQS